MKEKLVEDINLNPVLLRKVNIDKVNIEEINSLELLIPDRFDLVAKYLYVKYYVEKIKSNFAKEIYLKHIEVFNGFYEADGSNKIGSKKFLNAFNTLIDSIIENGYDCNSVIPYNNEGILLDGAHRLACSLYFNFPTNGVSLNIESKKFNYKFFKDLGLDQTYLEAMATEYIKMKRDNLYLVFIWPTSGGGKTVELEAVFNKYGKKVYQKELYLNRNGSVNLIRKLYKNEDWLGSYKDDYIGAQNKASWCFRENGPVNTILFESNEDMVLMKEEIRNIYRVDKHSVHITDTMEEANELGRIVFNKNTVEWLNISLFQEFSWFNKLFEHYKKWLIKTEYPSDLFCVDGSGVLSVYGLRAARDLDFLYSGTENVKTGFKEIDCHNERLENKKHLIDNIIFDPRNHFYFDSIKFLSLDLLLNFKSKRAEEKDLEDVKLIKDLRSGGVIKRPLKKEILKRLKISYWKGKIKFMLLKCRYKFFKIINEI